MVQQTQLRFLDPLDFNSTGWDLTTERNNMESNYKLYRTTEFGSFYTPCKVVDKLNNTMYNVEYFDDVSGQMIREVVNRNELEVTQLLLS